MILVIVVFILILGVLILSHELGHFWAARLAGIKVEELAFGFPPRLWKRQKGETVYSINLIPLGGYVKLLGEERRIKNRRSFSQKPVRLRLMVIAAGVVMNLILAWLLLAGGFMLGMTPLASDSAKLGGVHEPMIIISQVAEGQPASSAGIEPGTQILGFDSISAVQKYLKIHAKEKVTLKLKNLESKAVFDKEVTLAEEEAPLGVGLYETAKVKLGLVPALVQGAKETGLVIGAIFQFIGQFFKTLFSEGRALDGGVGPVGMFGFVSQAVKLGWVFVIQLTALISINLAIINILPFPALDGGRLIFLGLEGLLGRKIVREQIEGIIHTLGFILLIILILAITYRDIANLS